MKLEEIKQIKKSVLGIYLLLALILLNFLMNLLVEKNLNFGYLTQNIYDYFSSFLLFFYLYFIGLNISKNILKSSVSFGIFIYLSSFFVLELILSILMVSISTNHIFWITNMIWIALLGLKKIKSIQAFSILISYIFLNLFNNLFLDSLSKNKNIVGDVKAVFFEQSTKIFENGYEYSVKNYVFEGYPQFVSYIQSLLLRISLITEDYIYLSSTSYVIYFLTLLLIYETKTSNKNKFFISFLFTAMLFNSHFMLFLFTNSLMSEGIVSLFFAIVFKELLKYKNLSNTQIILVFTGLGLLYLTKQFISLFVLIFFLFFLFIKKTRKYSLFILFGFLLNQISYFFLFKGINPNHHLSQIDLKDTIVDILIFRDVKYGNVLIIFENLLKDRPFSIFLLTLFLTFFMLFYLHGYKEFTLNFIFITISLNIIFVFLLYSSVWRNMELESPIRYLFNLFHLKLISLQLNLENVNE